MIRCRHTTVLRMDQSINAYNLLIMNSNKLHDNTYKEIERCSQINGSNFLYHNNFGALDINWYIIGISCFHQYFFFSSNHKQQQNSVQYESKGTRKMSCPFKNTRRKIVMPLRLKKD